MMEKNDKEELIDLADFELELVNVAIREYSNVKNMGAIWISDLLYQ